MFGLACRQSAHLALAIAMAVVLAYPFQQLRWMLADSNESQLGRIRAVHALTCPGDRVLDGFSGVGYFRPSAWRYAFLLTGIRTRVRPDELAELTSAVATGRHAPKVVIFDKHLRNFDRGLTRVIQETYVPSIGYLDILVRRETPPERSRPCPGSSSTGNTPRAFAPD
jgi:hypothetical protein